ncbi:MAG: helicase-associated domain-containing protein [Acidimicrobiales bacterium]
MATQMTLVLGTQADPKLWWSNVSDDRTTFAQLLSGLNVEQIAAILTYRPGLMEPAPRHFEDLQARLMSVADITSCIRSLDHFAVSVLETLVLVKNDRASGDVAWLAGTSFEDLIGNGARDSEIEAALVKLEDRALLLRADGWIRLNPTVGTLNTPASLGPPAVRLLRDLSKDDMRLLAKSWGTGLAGSGTRETLVDAIGAALADHDRVRSLVKSAPPRAAALARSLAVGRPVVSHSHWDLYRSARSNPDDPVGWLASHGLVIANSAYSCCMPREVSLALRDGKLFPGVTPSPPPIGTRASEVAGLDDLASEAAGDIVATLGALLESLSTHPAQGLKAGGIGIREVRRLADVVGRSEYDVAELIEYAHLAGLVALELNADGSSKLLATHGCDAWLVLTAAERWAKLTAAWLDSPESPSAARSVDSSGKLLPPLAGMFGSRAAARHRRALLDGLAGLPQGCSADMSDLVRAVEWSVPPSMNDLSFPSSQQAEYVLDDARTLGLAFDLSLSHLGRMAAAGQWQAAGDWLLARFGPESTELVLQGDLTAFVPGEPARACRERLDLVADTESVGGGSLYRFSEASIRRGLESGLTAEEIAEWLLQHSKTPVPQPLSYLIADVARRYGTIRVGTAKSFVRSDDPALLADVANNKKIAKLAPRQIAPTVLVSDAAPAQLLDTLHAAGYLAAQEGRDGAVIVKRASRPRARQEPARASMGAAIEPHRVSEVARRLVASADRAVAAPTSRKATPARSAASAGSWERPAEIFRTQEELRTVLTRACDADWVVRVSLALGSGTTELNAYVAGLDDELVDLVDVAQFDQGFDGDFDWDSNGDFDDDVDGGFGGRSSGDIVVLASPITTVSWVRVLTSEEEDLL